jgi:cytidine deaminase
MDDIKKMLQMAGEVRERAYAPYSHFKVGAVIKSKSGNFYVGCDVENAAYPSGTCAEEAAIAAMVAGGDYEIEKILILAGGDEVTSPCGACRQRIREFAEDDAMVYMYNVNGESKSSTLSDLLPLSFSSKNLQK